MLLPSLRKNTKNLNAEVINVGLSDKPEKLKFMVSQRDDSSRFGVNPSELPDDFKEFIDVEVVNLDSFQERIEPDAGCIVKIDAEGLDLKVLRGGRSVLKNASFVFVEAGVVNAGYENSLLSIISEMDAMGFRILDISDINLTPHREMLWLLELCFIRSDIFEKK